MNRPSLRAMALGAVALLALAGLGWAVATQGPLAPVKVTVTQPRMATLALSVFGIGTVEVRRSYNIGPTAAGRVLAVLADQGDSVAAGQRLAEMDPVDLDERIAAATAAAARAVQLVRGAEATVAEVVSRARLAQGSAERYSDLRRKNFVSQEVLDARNHELAAAKAAVAAAEAGLAAARQDATRTAAERNGAGKARAQLRLTSPVAGVVAARLAEPGTTLVAGQAVLQLIDPASLWVRARIDQGRSAGLAPGLAVAVSLRSRPGQVLAGHIERVELIGDAVTEERIASIAFDTMPSGLTLGELAEVSIRLPAIDQALVVPAAAVKHVDKSEGVWLLQDGRTVFRAIVTGARSQDGLVEVRSGLAAGDSVVVYSGRALAPELRVKVVDALVRSGS